MFLCIWTNHFTSTVCIHRHWRLLEPDFAVCTRNRTKKTYLDLLLDLSFACPSSIIRFGEFDRLPSGVASFRPRGFLDAALPDRDLDLFLGLPLADLDFDRLLATCDLGL